MTGYDGIEGTPTVVELDYVQVNTDNSLRARVRLADGTHMEIDFAEGSAEMRDFLNFLGRIVSARLAALADGGVIVAGLTPAPADTEDDD